MKVNLEKELIRQNRRASTPNELLFIKEYDRLGADMADNEVLQRLGLTEAIETGKAMKETGEKRMEDIARFNQERVFHISQIEALCKKYYLRFLPTAFFKGSLDQQIPTKVSQFEIAYGVTCKTENCYIAAPPTSFKLEEKPKDPLLFYEINDQYYYLIHKWGNDISVFRRLMTLFSNSRFCGALILAICSIISTTLALTIQNKDGAIAGGIMPILGAIFLFSFFKAA